MAKCSGCLNLINNDMFLKCVRCKECYHHMCLNIRDDQFLTLQQEVRNSWICPACSNVSRRVKNNNNTPVRQHQLPIADISMNMSFDVQDSTNVNSLSQSEYCQASCGSGVTMEKISTLFDQKMNSSLTQFMQNFRSVLKKDIKEMVRAEVGNAIKEMKVDLNNTTEFISAEQQTLKAQIAAKDSAIKALDTKCAHLQGEVTHLNRRITSIEKMTRSHNIEIQAVPESGNENVFLIFKKICEVVKFSIDDNSIHACRRVAKMDSNSKRPRNVLVTFSSPRIKDSLLSAVLRFNKAHSKDTLNSRHLGMTGETRKIYVVEHQSPECKQLHAAARKFARDQQFKYVWVKYGRVYLRKDDNSGSIFVRDLEALDKMS